MQLRSFAKHSFLALPWVLTLGFFVYAGIQYTAVTGNFSLTWKPSDKTVNNLQPLGRASTPFSNLETGEVYQRITSDPVYLEVDVPRTFESVKATVNIKNTDQPLIEMGVQKGDVWEFDLHPLDIPLITDLDWSQVSSDAGILLQKQPILLSVDDFLHELPLHKRIGVYHQELTPTYVMQPVVPAPSLDVGTPLRGSHVFQVYAQDQDVEIDLTVLDMNRGFDADPITITLSQAGQVLAQTMVEDDGDVIADGRVSPSRVLRVSSGGPVSGVLELVVSATDDLVISRLQSSVGYLVTHELFLAGNPEYQVESADFSIGSTSLINNGRMVTAVTSHPVGLQTLEVDGQELKLEKVNTSHQLLLSDDSRKIVFSPANDVTVTSDGWLAFSDESFFDPDYLIERITSFTPIDDLDFIYTIPLPQENDQRLPQVTFDLASLPGDKKHLNFIFSAPGLDKRKADFTISSIEFEFRRPPLTLRGVYERLKQRLSI